MKDEAKKWQGFTQRSLTALTGMRKLQRIQTATIPANCASPCETQQGTLGLPKCVLGVPVSSQEERTKSTAIENA
jgi:hypothetical protein